MFTRVGARFEFTSVVAITHVKCSGYADGQPGPFDGRQHTHWVIAIKAGTAAGRQCSAITKSHIILLRRKYFRGRGLEYFDCREISDRRLNKIRCETCGSSIKVKPIGSKRYLLNVLKYLQRASAEPQVQNAAVGNETSFDSSWFGVGVPGNGSSTPKRQQDESLNGEEQVFSVVKDTVTLETHIQYIAYISFSLIFFPHLIIFSESQINSLSNDIKYLLVFFSRK